MLNAKKIDSWNKTRLFQIQNICSIFLDIANM
jgi:hypothetical protein